MAHYAFLDETNIVVEVITGHNEDEIIEGISNWEKHYENFRELTCKRTSYNTWAGEHKLGKTPFRGNYAGIGYLYDPIRDAFIPPAPFASWVIDDNTFQWKTPINQPTEEGDYAWSELQTNWILRPEKPDASTAWFWDYGTDQWIEFA